LTPTSLANCVKATRQTYQIETLPQALSEIEDSFRWIADNISATTAGIHNTLLYNRRPGGFAFAAALDIFVVRHNTRTLRSDRLDYRHR
jgi:hypothetical protein